METISFALGVASVLVVLLGTVTVWVTLRVKKIIKENLHLENVINNLEQAISRRFENLEHHYSDEIKEIYNTIHSRVDVAHSRIQEESVTLQRHIEHILETSKKYSDDCNKYTDSRIDKLRDEEREVNEKLVFEKEKWITNLNYEEAARLVNNPKFCLNKDKELLTD